MKVRVVPFHVDMTRAVTEDGEFAGDASVFGVKDSYETFFDAGCFARTLKHHQNEVPITQHHDARVGIGMAHAEETDKGLRIDPGRLNIKRSAQAVEVYGGLPHRGEAATGYYSQMSHGFDPVVVERDADGFVHFREVKLYEIAIVMRNFAANPKANIKKVRARLEACSRALVENRVDELGDLFSRFADSLDEFIVGGKPKDEKQDDPDDGRTIVVPDDEQKILSTIRETEALFLDIVGSPESTRRREDSPLAIDSLEHSTAVALQRELRAIGEDLNRSKEKGRNDAVG
jgi:HK97 family phage prohead protease